MTASATTQVPQRQSRLGIRPDDTTPIPRPSRYYGRRQKVLVSEQIGSSRGETEQKPLPAPPLAPAAANTLSGCIDKSELTFGEPKQLRDKAHLK